MEGFQNYKNPLVIVSRLIRLTIYYVRHHYGIPGYSLGQDEVKESKSALIFMVDAKPTRKHGSYESYIHYYYYVSMQSSPAGLQVNFGNLVSSFKSRYD